MFACLILMISQAAAQAPSNLVFTRFDSKKELPSDEYKMIFQDKNDLLWFGSNIGLLQFDGYDFTLPGWLAETPYANIEFNGMTSDSTGNLYMATVTGLLIYSPATGILKAIQPSVYLKDNSINNNCSSLAYDKNGKIWFGSNSGIYCYWLKSDSISSYMVVDRNWKGSVNAISVFVGQNGDVWIGTWARGLARFNSGRQQFERVYCRQNPVAENIKAIKEDKNGRLWVGGWKNGLFVLDISNSDDPVVLKHFTHNPLDSQSIAGNIIYDLDFDEQNNAWIGTPYGLSVLKGGLTPDPRFVNYQQDSEHSTISNNEIRAVWRDHSGLMWLATWGGGINKGVSQNRDFDFFPIPVVDPLIKSQSVYSFTKDQNDRLLIGVQGLGFGEYDLKKRKFTPFSSMPEFKNLAGLNLNTARCFEWDNESNLWIGDRYKGIIKVNPGTGEFINLHSETADERFPVREVFSIKSDKKGNSWIATNNGLFSIGHGKSGRFDDLVIVRYAFDNRDEHTLSDNSLSDLAIDDKGYLWVSTFSNGLSRSRERISETDKLSFERYSETSNPECGLGTNKIICLFKDRSGRIWIGTVGKGLKYWNQELNRFEQPELFDSLNGMVVYSVTEDSGRNLWITSNRGLSRIHADKGIFEIEQFSVSDGLQGNVFIKGSAFLDANSNLFVGGHNGFNRFNPNQIRIKNYTPKILITSSTIDNRLVNISLNSETHPLVMTHTNKYFTVDFSSLDYLNPDQNKYAYMLEGFNNTWQFANSNARSASFGNLNPGKYKLVLKGTNSSGKWNPAPTCLYILVKTAPYKTWWAIIGYILLLSSLVYLFLALRIKNIQIQKSLELENIKRTKLENLTQFKLQFFTNISHELLTPLSILKILAEDWDEFSGKKASDFAVILERNVSRLHTLIKQLLQFRKAETGNMKLNPLQVDIVPVIKSICSNYHLLAAKKNISFGMELPSHMDCFMDVEKLDIMLNNLLSNAFKYSLDGGSVQVLVTSLEKSGQNWVRMEVTDHGIGMSDDDQKSIFDLFYRIGQINVNQTGIGIGLALTRNLVSLHGGSIVVNSTLGKGASFCIELPASSEFYRQSAIQPIDPMIDPEKIVSAENNDEVIVPAAASERFDKVVLLVENEEDYRTLLTEQLKKYVQVISCKNGKEAFEAAHNQHIDIVVSDLNMPEMNGNELCRAMKSDPDTSHIPFILITALPDDKDRLLSYDSGVDSFLSKPLNINILISRIKSLLKKREVIQQRFNKGALLEPAKLATSSLDEKIILKAKSVIEANIADPEFSVKMLCDELGMTNSTLYRKMKGILNMMPNEFIRNIRLRRAAQLLEDAAIDIAEAAYLTGFNDPSYFSACFKKQYGVTPSAYNKGERSQTD